MFTRGNCSRALLFLRTPPVCYFFRTFYFRATNKLHDTQLLFVFKQSFFFKEYLTQSKGSLISSASELPLLLVLIPSRFPFYDFPSARRTSPLNISSHTDFLVMNSFSFRSSGHVLILLSFLLSPHLREFSGLCSDPLYAPTPHVL